MPPLSATVTATEETHEEMLRGNRIVVHPHGNEDPKKQPWRPWPWNSVPDRVAAAMSLAVLVPAAPFMGILIGTVTGSFAIFRWLHRVLGLQAVNNFVLGTAKAAAPYLLVDVRNYTYLPYIFFLMFWCPALLYWAYYRQ